MNLSSGTIRELRRRAWKLIRRVGTNFMPPVVHKVLKRIVSPPVPVASRSGEIHQRYRSGFNLPELTVEDVRAKAKVYRALAADTRLDRVRLLRELARLAQLEENVPLACLYRLRAMRYLGRDAHDDLLWVGPALEKSGFKFVAETVAALYGRVADREAACERLLEEQFERSRRPIAPVEFALVDDRRRTESPRVSVILSLYNAADKLPAFLQALQLQTLNRAGLLELIAVDSASPADEHRAWRDVELAFPLSSLFVRTHDRETIQTAWNRGIALARAPYLCLLGVDETMTPESLAELAGLLDAKPAVDWVQSDCLVAEVDRFGTQWMDVLRYDRTGFTPNHAYLDSCYLGPVGALYRKSIHERVGYFDGSFRGAGDTEFKSRMLPLIQIERLPKTFGVFLNYPEERTTASPMAEIEDFRAWYLHRSAGGIRRAFRHRTVEELEALLRLCLGYRKSYRKNSSTDFELAEAVVSALRERKPSSPSLATAPGIARVLQAHRLLDNLPSVEPARYDRAVAEAKREVAEAFGNLGLPLQPGDGVFNDNRHEHHDWFW